jgi:hypothetical protein
MDKIKIADFIKSLKEGDLTKYDLENISSELDIFCAEMEIRLAEIEKKGALFLNECGEKTRAGAERLWNASPDGQEEISLKRNLRAINKLSTSVKTRIYQRY